MVAAPVPRADDGNIVVDLGDIRRKSQDAARVSAAGSDAFTQLYRSQYGSGSETDQAVDVAQYPEFCGSAEKSSMLKFLD